MASASLRSNDSSIEAVYQSKLLRALRSGDPSVIHPFLIDLSERAQSKEDGSIDLAASTLHLAIRCASYDTIKLILANRVINPNGVHPPGSGTTPLHLAASLGRDDIVGLLLEHPNIDDTARDSAGKTCKDVARGKESVAVIQQSRAILDARYLSVLHTYTLSPPQAQPPADLISILESPRARLLNLAQQEQTSGSTLLHEAARRKDLRLVELAIRAGTDVFCRDRKGRSINDVAGKDDRVKVFLRQYTNRNTALIEPQPAGEPGVLKGYLNKYTNVAKGYGTRWFVLKDGVLSYYRNQADEGIASRGSISMKSAIVKTSNAADKLRFEVHSHLPSRPGPSSTTGVDGNVQKWYLKANHYVELTRWTNALSASIEWSHRNAQSQHTPSIHDSSDFFDQRSLADGSSSVRTHGTGTMPKKRLSTPYQNSLHDSSRRSIGSVADEDASGPDGPAPGHEDDEDSFDSSRSAESNNVPPHTGVIEVHSTAIGAQLDTTASLVSALLANKGAATTSRKQEELHKELTDTIATAQESFITYKNMVEEREEWWRNKLEKEHERAGIWEESLQIAAKEGEELEQELRKRGRARGRRRSMSASVWTFADGGGSTIRVPKPAKRPDVPGVQAAYDGLPEPKIPPSSSLLLSTTAPAPPTADIDLTLVPVLPNGSRVIVPPESLFMPQSNGLRADDGEGDTDEEDEFFDAIESNTLPVTIPPTMEKSPIDADDLPPSIDVAMYASYAHLRERLPISADNRPPVSLWAVLKNSIGKDLTKISFPVFFNEPTSMLQRMAEDMEFSQCLDAAAVEKDQFKRIAFVAAFAMSNYSSTIGRIAKPFNPMLGETFEYVRHDRRYRYVSEQVSHHPPMSACWAQSPIWSYYGEVDAQNKFMGKSFEIRPTGIAHAELNLPEASYEGRGPVGKIKEHFTWKKVTTSVSGFILGSPTIDHYGEMTVTNHQTGDKCILTFKPRGWRGRDAFEIAGRVVDSSGRVRLDIAGRWNSQLVARTAGTGVGDLLPDVSVDQPSSPSTSPEYILLWRNTPKPPMPFNLTPFAITLNDCPEDLKAVMAPTDCRLRPDQRAFENGEYERANTLKQMQEEFQRATRRKREAGQLPPHKPRWFEARTDGDTGERVWMPHRVGEELEYWAERERIYRSKGTEKWRNVEQIFISDDA